MSLWSRVKGWFAKDEAKPAEESDDLYKPEKRRIYHYFDGQTIRRADPMSIFKRYFEVRMTLSADLKSAKVKSKWSEKAYADAIAAMRNIFDVKPFEEGGLTEGETQQLFWHFVSYCETIKKNYRTSPTSPEETSSSTASASEELPPTLPSSDSGSTANEPPTAPPTLPPSVSV